MGNVALALRILSDNGELYTPAYSGGSWLAALPLTNLKDRRLSLKARSTDALAASTLFDIDLGAARNIGIVALCGHNISTGATWRVTLGTSSGGSQVYDSGSLTPSFSTITAEDRAGFDPTLVHIPTAAQSARYCRVAITDTGNVDGYVEIGRCVVAERIVPTINAQIGVQLGLETDTIRTVTDGSSAVYDARPVRRTARFVLDHQTAAEGMGSHWKLQRLLGTSGQTLFVFDIEDTTYLHERSFLGVLRQLSGVEFPWADGRTRTAYEVMEEL